MPNQNTSHHTQTKHNNMANTRGDKANHNKPNKIKTIQNKINQTEANQNNFVKQEHIDHSKANPDKCEQTKVT